MYVHRASLFIRLCRVQARSNSSTKLHSLSVSQFHLLRHYFPLISYLPLNRSHLLHVFPGQRYRLAYSTLCVECSKIKLY